MNLRTATPAEQAAAVKSAIADISHLIDMFMGSGFASMFRNQAIAKLASPEGHAQVVKVVADALAAAEGVREAAEAAPAGGIPKT